MQAIELSGETLNRLRHLQPVRKPDGQLYFNSGNFAVVFRMEDTRTGGWVALRCFLREVPRRRERLTHIADYIRQNPSPHLLPITFHPQEIWVDTRFGQSGEFDLMTMPWVEGQTLATFVANCCAAGDATALRQLALRFDAFANWLLAQPVAHGDLKPDNIIVGPDGTLRLIDYDGCYVPTLHGLSSPELGSPPYRHPNRSPAHFHQHLDDFSLLLLSLELHALSHSPELYTPMDSLLISSADLDDFNQSACWQQLRQLPSADVKARLALLEFACHTPVGPVLSLKTLVAKQVEQGFQLLIPYYQKGRWGFVDKERKLLVPCTYDEAGAFSEGMAPVRMGAKYGYVNQQGVVQIACQYDEAREFSDGLAVVRLPDGYRYIDPAGLPLSEHRFEEAATFQNGSAMVKQNGLWGFLNTAGQLTIPCQFESVWPFANGLARIRQGNDYQFIDRRGQVVIAGPFTYSLNFSDGLAAVEQAGKFGFIDGKGQFAIPPIYEEVGFFAEGLASVRQNGRVGFINKQGELVIPFRYEPLLMSVLFPFSEGLAIIKRGGKFGFINVVGEEVIPPTFDEAGNFSEGLAFIKKNKKWGFVNASGQVVIPCLFDHAYSFRRGLARVSQENMVFFVDSTGFGYLEK